MARRPRIEYAEQQKGHEAAKEPDLEFKAFPGRVSWQPGHIPATFHATTLLITPYLEGGKLIQMSEGGSHSKTKISPF